MRGAGWSAAQQPSAQRRHPSECCQEYAPTGGRAHVANLDELLAGLANETLNCLLLTNDIVWPTDFYDFQVGALDPHPDGAAPPCSQHTLLTPDMRATACALIGVAGMAR